MGKKSAEIGTRLEKIRQKMKSAGADFFFVPSSDAHRNEYVPPKWQRRSWLSGFTGSAGDLIVSAKKAFLWTDGRYTQQARKELDLKLFDVFEYSQGAVASIDLWLASQPKGTVFALDPSTISITQAKKFAAVLDELNGKLSYISPNWIDEVQGPVEEPSPASVFIQPLEFSGASIEEKLARVRACMVEQKADVLLLNVLDEIAWLFNLRGNDVAYNPFFISYASITSTKAELFIDLKKITPEVKSYLAKAKVSARDYSEFERMLLKLKGNVWLDPSTANAWMYGLVSHAHRVSLVSPIVMMKAIKNDVEILGAKNAHLKDALSYVTFMEWLEQNWTGQTEISVAEKLESFRRQDPSCRDLSFATIAGFGPNGSIIHYHANETSNAEITGDNLFLLDSGGQYLEGTTDITRVFHFGTPSAAHKRWYTRVLKGHLRLRRTVFCHGTRGEHLDALARLNLWEAHANYAHGTGHGVGAYLCVHEGPQRISIGPTSTPLLPGMILSNEPGVYLEGDCGVRIENLILVVEKSKKEDSPSGHGPFYGFEDLTLVPYERKLIDLDLLNKEEIEQINAYHLSVEEKLSPLLTKDVVKYLKEKTKPL
jgi:Xaa-Pro aminopeptidase